MYVITKLLLLPKVFYFFVVPVLYDIWTLFIFLSKKILGAMW